MSEKLLLIDGHSILHRAYYGVPDLTNSKGQHTNAVYGFLNILLKFLEEEKPDYLTVAFDLSVPTFRHKRYEAYKGTRKPMEENLREQVPLMQDMLRSMGVRIVTLEGYEADDLLGTLAKRGEREGMEVALVSGDRDLLQIASDHICIRIPKTKGGVTTVENYYAADVKATYQVTPTEFIDVKALQGDTADNIPGVPKIGEKTAQALISQYGSIEAVHDHAAEVKPPVAAKNIVEYWDQAVLSKELATIETAAPLTYDFEEARLGAATDLITEEARDLCSRLELRKLLSRFDQMLAENGEGKEARCSRVEIDASMTRIITEKEADSLFKKMHGRDYAFFVAKKPGSKRDSKEEANGQMNLFGLTTENRFEGLAVVLSDTEIYYLECNDSLTSDHIAAGLAEASEGKKITPNLKEALKEIPWQVGADDGMRQTFYDTGVAAYLLNPILGKYPLDYVAESACGLQVPRTEELVSKETEDYMRWACYEAYVAWKAYPKLTEELKNRGMEELYRSIELPLIFVLSDMEQEGVRIDPAALKEYGAELQTSIETLEKRIYEAAGEEFNINSPKQLGTLLFEKLMLPYSKKPKKGKKEEEKKQSYSTAADILNPLSKEYPIVADILEYRQLTKLKSTYADGLAAFADEEGVIHTTFNQTITATGRLSSTDPNLQNIPIRIELGKLIRKVFLPREGNLFVDSDYSQIELRVLAHMSGDENLIEAFRRKQDIHRTTASQVFNTPFEEVTDLQRRNAKAVNFGIVYGISAHSLSEDLKISYQEAQDYIDRYFATYPKVKAFLDDTVEGAKKNGNIRTLYGRIRPIPELASAKFMDRQSGERIAMNSPIQGTAADIIKIAMIRVHDRLIREGYASKLILQVHDELLIDTVESERDAVIALLEEEMGRACKLQVDLEVGTAYGKNWYEAH